MPLKDRVTHWIARLYETINAQTLTFRNYGQFRGADQPIMCVFGLREEAGKPGETRYSHECQPLAQRAAYKQH